MADYRIALPFGDFEMSNPSDVWHPPCHSQAETKSQETAEEADFDKELTDGKKEKVGCGCLKVFYWLVAKCLLGLLNVMDLGQKLGPMI